MAEPARRQPAALLPDLLDWLSAPWGPPPPFTAGRGFRLEEYAADDHYVIRAELPGIDPGKDLDITISDQALTIHAERREQHRQPRHSEFRYGSFTRTIPLPPRADTGHATATYTHGVLQISVPVPTPKPGARRITIKET